VEPKVIKTARRHGIKRADILHAYDNPIVIFDQDDDTHMIIATDRTGHTLLEVGYLLDDHGQPVIIHADRARRKYLDRL
jgi:hypothetical protein